MKFTVTLIILFFGFCTFAQDQDSNYRTTKVAVKNSIVIDSVSINSSSFNIKTKDDISIDSTFYSVDFARQF